VNREILQDCIPSFLALAVAFALLAVVIRLSGARLSLRRLASLHRCQEGGVQSLAFVLTLPLFIMILLFIVQVSQLMTGLVQVNYAAYASARAASVWIPAHIDDEYNELGWDINGENELPPGISPGIEFPLTSRTVAGLRSRKYEKIFTAAALACAPMCPSRATPDGAAGLANAGRAASAMKQLYPQFDPAGNRNPRIPARIDNKLGYSFENTYVTVKFEDRNSQPIEGTRTYNPIAHPTVAYYSPEVGWQDPVTITVYHDFALLPGPGRFLANLLVREDGKADLVSPRVHKEGDVYTTRISASATMTNEGIRSVKPYVHGGS
jgi:hypothetical protein